MLAVVRDTTALILGLGALALAATAQPAAAQSEPSSVDGPTRAPEPFESIPDPEVMDAIVGVWRAEIADGSGGTSGWQLDLHHGGTFELHVAEDGQVSTRTGVFEVDAMSVRLIYPGATDETDPNSTALNLSDARSLETYFYRLLGPDRLAFRPTLCRYDPCQWIADRVE